MFFDCRWFSGTKHVVSPIVLGTSPIPNTREDATKKNQWGQSCPHPIWSKNVKSRSRWWFQIYFAYESRHQHGAFDMTGGFKYFFIFTTTWGNKWSNLTNIFQMGWNHQLGVDIRLMNHFLGQRGPTSVPSALKKKGLGAPMKTWCWGSPHSLWDWT